MSELERRFDRLEKQMSEVSARSCFEPGNQAILSDDEIDLRELFNVLWRGKWWITGITFFFSVVGVFIALSLPNIYRSEALLAPAEENSGGGLSALAGNLGGLASLAGVNLNGGGGDKTSLAIEVLKSREFITKFIQKNDVLVPLMAAKDWDQNQNKLLLDSSVYDEGAGVWVRDVSPPKTKAPSMQEAYRAFSELLTVSQDKTTNYVTVGVEFYSPEIAKLWVEKLVSDINSEIKDRDVAEAQKSVEYLTQQLEKTSVADMKSVFYSLIEEQTKTVMFAEARDEYVFSTIDPAIVPELKSKPKRALIAILSAILGGLLSVFIVLVRHFVVAKNDTRMVST